MAQAACTGVAWVGGNRFWFLAFAHASCVVSFLFGPQFLERSDRHIHLAANLEHLRNRHTLLCGERLWHHRDRLHVLGHVLAHPAVTSGGGLHEDSAFVAQAHRQPVDLQLTYICMGLAGQTPFDSVPPGP